MWRRTYKNCGSWWVEGGCQLNNEDGGGDVERKRTGGGWRRTGLGAAVGVAGGWRSGRRATKVN